MDLHETTPPVAHDERTGGQPRAAAKVIPLPSRARVGHDPELAPAWSDAASLRAAGNRALTREILTPLAAAVAVAVATWSRGTPYEGAMIALLVYGAVGLVLRRNSRHVRLLRLVNPLVTIAPILAGTGLLAGVQALTGLPGIGRLDALLITVAAALPTLVLPSAFRRSGPLRVAVIGSATTAAMLARELAVAGVDDFTLAGIIGHPSNTEHEDVLELGGLDNLGAIVEAHRIDLLLMTSEAPRLEVFEELAAQCLHLPVRLWELSGFYEEVFGHVPVAEINASWFQYIMHPNYRVGSGNGKRAFDLAVSAMFVVFLAPLIGLLALLVKRDGGPAFFRQDRIGEGGRRFTVLKLRTMIPDADSTPRWATAADDRVTPVGRFLRRTHLDELPQIFNVLRGDMSLVGPRPEQPGFVEKLESSVPFYSRRHLVKPGVTGWAQVRCGYAGSEFGSAWKLCHDLYYLKHRSMGLDLAIIVETLRTLVADAQYDVHPAGVSFILRPAVTAEAQPGIPGV